MIILASIIISGTTKFILFYGFRFKRLSFLTLVNMVFRWLYTLWFYNNHSSKYLFFSLNNNARMRVYNIYKYNSYNTHDLKNNSNHFLSLFYFKKFF